VDQTFGTTVRYTQGGLAEFTVDNHSQDARVYGWGGGGGSMIYVQPELQIAMAFLTNSFGVRVAFADPRPRTLLASLFDSVLEESKAD
jgi:CubicO group peptidase (beta-lactamase class C family)